jgi:hypothetical protein
MLDPVSNNIRNMAAILDSNPNGVFDHMKELPMSTVESNLSQPQQQYAR